ncbi:unnamed protein product [Moneuplotes crassus]|uniref:NADH-cytochrome b5 reductase n=1 Tax=Euplotes crassus TaxID=5936 RepID=A0AAD1XJE3_EUPCR|nr:unnamed protein product [Moneuplotes crassus]
MRDILALLAILAPALAAQYKEENLKIVEGEPTPFSHWSWVWAVACIVILLCMRAFLKNKTTDSANVNVKDELDKRDGVYRRKDFEADNEGVLQALPKDEDGCIKLPLTKRTKINHDTYHFRFDFPSKDQEFGLHIGGHVVFYAEVMNPETGKKEEIARKYTPVSTVHQKGYIEFVIKIYRAGENPRFPHGGLMTQYLEKLRIGESLKMEGPMGKLSYLGCGNFYISKKYHIKTEIGMIAGGSGITPIYQIIQSVVHNKDKIKCHLLFGNKSEKDILIREELEQLQEDYPENFKLTYIIDKADNPDTWKGETGYITQEILEKYMPKAGDETLIVTCGPPIMNQLAKKFLPEHMIHKF